MPSLFSAFASEVFRPLVTLLIPGVIGISPWFLAMVWRFDTLRNLVTQNHAEASFMLLLAVVFAGMVFEDFGARLEVLLDKRIDEQTNGLHTKNWYLYLRTAYKPDPIGRGYIRNLVLRFKFELGTAFSMISAALGLIWLFSLGLDCSTFLTCESLCISLLIWGLYEARSTHEVLSCTRTELLKGVLAAEHNDDTLEIDS